MMSCCCMSFHNVPYKLMRFEMFCIIRGSGLVFYNLICSMSQNRQCSVTHGVFLIRCAHFGYRILIKYKCIQFPIHVYICQNKNIFVKLWENKFNNRFTELKMYYSMNAVLSCGSATLSPRNDVYRQLTCSNK